MNLLGLHDEDGPFRGRAPKQDAHFCEAISVNDRSFILFLLVLELLETNNLVISSKLSLQHKGRLSTRRIDAPTLITAQHTPSFTTLQRQTASSQLVRKVTPVLGGGNTSSLASSSRT